MTTPLTQTKDWDVDHSIDVRYEEDVLLAFDKFIEKWCGKHYPHLIDTDENDGEFMREKIEDLVSQTRQQTLDECLEIIGEPKSVEELEDTMDELFRSTLADKVTYKEGYNKKTRQLRQAINSLKVTKE